MMKFKPNRKSYIKGMLMASLILPAIIVFLARESFLKEPGMLLPVFLPFFIFLWIYFGTYYIIKDNKLFYRSAFFRGQIDISKIREIVKGRTAWTGIRPATATKGLLIKFNTYDEVYISPQDNNTLIDALKQINDKIKVTE